MKEPKIVVANVRYGLLRNIDIHLYCGRSETPEGMVRARMGNPFWMKDESMRQEVIDNYDQWLRRRGAQSRERQTIRTIAERLTQGKSVALYCHCAPRACHCDIIRNRALFLYNRMKTKQ